MAKEKEKALYVVASKYFPNNEVRFETKNPSKKPSLSKLNRTENNNEEKPDEEKKYFNPNSERSVYEIAYFKRLEREKPATEPKFVPPRSPYNLLEEYVYHDPWALLVATIFLNKTTCVKAKPNFYRFLLENPDPQAVIRQLPENLEKHFENLGFQKIRSVQVWRMSNDFLFKKWKNARDLFGIGHYGDCAFRMFCLGDFEIHPTDKFLKLYKSWYERFGKYGG